MKKTISFTISFITLAALSCMAINEADIIARISVNSGNYERFETPVSVSIDFLTHIHEEELGLYEYINGEHKPVPVQFSPGEERRMHWLLSGSTRPGAVRIFDLAREKPAGKSKIMKVDYHNGSYTMFAGDKPVLEYNSGTVYPPPEANQAYRRSGFVHPLYSPEGNVLTAIQPPDHLHHYGMWNPWTRTTLRGEEIDFWNLAKEQGRVRYSGTASLEEGAVFGSLEVLHEHIAWPDTPDEFIAMNELQELRVYNRSDGTFLIDVISKLNPVETITLEEYRYGGFVFRGTAEWTRETSDFFTSRGNDRDHADGQRAEWCVVTGKTASGQSGMVMMGYPANYNHPEPLRVWPSDANRGRGDVFINFSPTRNTSWTLEPGSSYMLRYRLLVFEGEADREMASGIWNDYSNPPLITLEKVTGEE